jgi:tetratricopeptide (TPR) repeat protein
MTVSLSNSAGAASGAELQRYLQGVERALRASDMETAIRLSDEAIGKGLEHSHLLALAAYRQMALGAGDRALVFASRARELSPRNVDVLNALGLSYVHLKRHREAVEAFDAALRQSPTAFMVRFNKAAALEELQDLTRARVEFERVLDQQPSHSEALARLASLAIQRGDVKIARDYATRALKSDPRQPAAPLTLAMADVEEKQFERALSRVEPLTRPANTSATNRSIAQGVKGEALEGLGRIAEAFDAFSQSQATLRAHYRPIYAAEGYETASMLTARLTDYFRTARAEDWRARGTVASPVRTHVFLVGFARSGTTLLEQILASHPDIEAMEERSCLVEAQTEFTVPPGGLDRLAKLGADELGSYRDAYWKRVREQGTALKRAVFIDKMPLYSVYLCVIAKLFPDARILFARRDPRDVVLSCFRRRFVTTAQMYEFTSLETTADYYDAVMGLSDLYRGKLGLDICDIRYEDMVADFAGETRRICAFLDLPWNEAMERFVDVARTRSVNTPSGPQIARGLFTQGAGQWRRYRDQLAPILPRLAPWVGRFGYAPD